MKKIIKDEVLGKIYNVRLFYGNGTARLVKKPTAKQTKKRLLNRIKPTNKQTKTRGTPNERKEGRPILLLK